MVMLPAGTKYCLFDFLILSVDTHGGWSDFTIERFCGQEIVPWAEEEDFERAKSDGYGSLTFRDRAFFSWMYREVF